jgi:choline dehydrogenase
MQATGVEYRTTSGEVDVAFANKEVILSAGAVGSPHLLMLSGIGPQRELESNGVHCLVDSDRCRKALEGPYTSAVIFLGAGPRCFDDRSRHFDGARRASTNRLDRLPSDPNDDVNLPVEMQALKQEAERRPCRVGNDGMRYCVIVIV